ncbi:MAG: glycosyltransferase, partial [Planctomycetota bacterium]
MRISLVIPVYNEFDSLQSLNDAIMASVQQHSLDVQEIVLVDDGSTDHSWEEIQRLSGEIAAKSDTPYQRIF